MLSVIIPVYNVEKYLQRCLDSLYAQTLKDIEFIIVDDGATDNSSAILNEFCKDKDIFKVFHKENGGLLSAWKYGVRQAQGDYVGFVDSDDYVDKDMFKTLYGIVKEKNVDIAMCNHYYVDVEGKTTNNINPVSEGLYMNDDFMKIKKLFIPKLNDNYVSPSRVTKIVRKEIVLKTIDSLNESITSAEDTYSTLQWMMLSNSFYYIEKNYYYYYKNSSSISYIYKPQIFPTYEIIIKTLASLNSRTQSVKENYIFNLYNFYGFLWCLYVARSDLSKKEKKNEIQRMTKDKDYKKALKYREKGHFLRKTLYGLTVRFNAPWLILMGIKMMEK